MHFHDSVSRFLSTQVKSLFGHNHWWNSHTRKYWNWVWFILFRNKFALLSLAVLRVELRASHTPGKCPATGMCERAVCYVHRAMWCMCLCLYTYATMLEEDASSAALPHSALFPWDSLSLSLMVDWWPANPSDPLSLSYCTGVIGIWSHTEWSDFYKLNKYNPPDKMSILALNMARGTDWKTTWGRSWSSIDLPMVCL